MLYIYNNNWICNTRYKMIRYSVFDAQLGKICEICNKSSARSAIKNIKKAISVECDITGLSDNDIFEQWKYVLFSHKKRVSANNAMTLGFLMGYDDIHILLPDGEDTSGTSGNLVCGSTVVNNNVMPNQ